MIRVLALAALVVCTSVAIFNPTTASAVCDCYHHGAKLRCMPSKAACLAAGGNRCFHGCSASGGP
jgi:hypothetical protein